MPYVAHTLNLLLKGIGKMSFVQSTLLDANHVVKFVQEHQFTYALFCTKSDKCLQFFCATRFATSYYILERLLQVRAALVETIVDQFFEAWVGIHKLFVVATNGCINLVTSTSFWTKVQKLLIPSNPLLN